jgi:DNA polymerase-3 subunit delta'
MTTTLADIRGQERAVDQLRRALDSGRVAHAYLFCGPAGCGKHTAAIAFSMALNCETEPGIGCGACAICERIARGIHPDVRTLEPKGPLQIIPIEDVRSQVVAAVGLPPHEARARVFIVEEAAALLGPSANALLKTLEEPPAATHFILGTSAPDKLLPTIRSRCQKVGFIALPPDVRAELHDGDDMHEKLDKLSDTLLSAIDDGAEINRLFDAAAEVAAEKTELAPALRLFAEKLHLQARAAVERRDLPAAARIARRASVVLDTELAVTMHNAHGQLALEAMLSQMRAIR